MTRKPIHLIAALFLTLLIVSCAGVSEVEVTDQPGYIYTIAGGPNANHDSGDGGDARDAEFTRIVDLAVNGSSLYVATEDRVRRIDLDTLVIETFAGGGDAVPAPGVNALGTALNPGYVATDGDERIWLIGGLPDDDDGRSRAMIVVIGGRSGVIERVVEVLPVRSFAVGRDGTAFWISIDPSTDAWEIWKLGPPGDTPRAFFEHRKIEELTVDRTGRVWVASIHAVDGGVGTPGRLLSVDPDTGSAETVAGPFDSTPLNPIFAQDEDPPLGAYRTKFSPGKLTVGPDNNIYYTQRDQAGSHIARIDPETGEVTVVAGAGYADYQGDGGPATEAHLRAEAIAFDADGNAYVVQYPGAIRRINALAVPTGPD